MKIYFVIYSIKIYLESMKRGFQKKIFDNKSSNMSIIIIYIIHITEFLYTSETKRYESVKTWSSNLSG